MTYTLDGTTQVWFVNTIANPNAPTAAEVNAGTALADYCTPDGWNVDTGNDTIPTSTLAGTDNTEDVGRRSDAPSLTMYDNGLGVAPHSLFNANQAGFLVERLNVAKGTTATAGHKVRLWPVKAKAPKRPQTASNEKAKIIVEFVKTGNAVESATLT